MDEIKVSTKTTGLAQHKIVAHALQMMSQTQWQLPKQTHYGALASMRWSTSIHFEPALWASILSEYAEVIIHWSAF